MIVQYCIWNVLLTTMMTAAAVGFFWARTEVCYDPYGCFRKEGLFTKLPASPYWVGTSFHLFTREGHGIVNANDQKNRNGHGRWASQIRDALLARDDYNVILVDWKWGAKIPYAQAAANTQLVGAQVAEFISFLISSSSGSSTDLAARFYIVGFSLGAQVAGFAGAKLKNSGIILGRITGLDPAGRSFTGAEERFRLDPSDAAFVDVVHTDAGNLENLGTEQIVGNTDFFPNGGRNQPGCVDIGFPVFTILGIATICHHYRAPEYYIATVQNPSNWTASPCQSLSDCKNGKFQACDGVCPTMGFGAHDPIVEGTFFLKTNGARPFIGGSSSSSASSDFPLFGSSCSIGSPDSSDSSCSRIVQVVLLDLVPCGPCAWFMWFSWLSRLSWTSPLTSSIIDDNDNNKLRASNFNISRRTIFVIHGFTESINTWATQMKSALLSREDCNVILVDWSKGAKLLTGYGQAAGNTRLVGAQVAELIRFLITNTSGSPGLANRFYIVGFSLGAQAAGYAGSYLRAKGMKLGRITGLDPASLFFTNRDATIRLDPGDAEYVDVIHTDAGGFGTSQKVGHIDFFPNGGSLQPGCVFNILKPMNIAKCDHMRAPRYYIASVKNSCSWRAYPCQTGYQQFTGGYCLSCNGACPSMGFDADRTNRTGTFYLQTNNNAPFCAGIEVCYGKYGCFSKAEPFNNLALLPLPPLVISPAFRLYTRSNTGQPQFINDYELTKLQNSNFNGSKKTVFVAHGYIEIKPKWMERIKDGLLRNVDCNVILVDWYRGSLPPYVEAAGNTRLVGAMIAELIKFLISQTQSSVDLYHVVGFSLGAHIAGYAGSRLKQNGLTLGRITGLDPAGPLFSTTDPAVRLDPSDARFVDIIHTDADRFGLYQTSGHIDFYPNGGLDQVGCKSLTGGRDPGDPRGSEGIRGDARVSEGIRGDPRGSEGTRGDPRGSEGIRGDPRGREGIRGDPRGSEGIRGDPRGSEGTRGHPRGSKGIRGDARGSEGIRGDPRGSEGIRGDPGASEGIRGDPRGSEGTRGDPRGSEGTRGDPRGPGGIRGDPGGSEGIRGDPRGSEGARGDPRGSGGIRGDPRGSEGPLGDPGGPDGLRGDRRGPFY
ncbi:hypothetical protein OS493_028466 [Desmophyllum pertusum]|uniref:Lipase domain-containing protein n=1 Tax=Desmophyllum pertusum TaxID=174260 RepID=A0A9X0D3D9_9CNID|nr:hypothetical protein OS493_028466 [Desmophyllum pertusum]